LGVGIIYARLERRTTNGKSASCTRADLISGRCGTIWGAVTDPNALAGMAGLQNRVGRQFDMTYRFHDIDDQIPTDDERRAVRAGLILHIDIAAQLFTDPQRPITWREVASGAFDNDLLNQARGIASLGAPVFLTFDHEPDQAARRARGTAADYVAAWRHIHALYARAGVTNVIWTWVVTGYPSSITTASAMWPGNSYVDWIGWEAYNASGCKSGYPTIRKSESFAASVLPFYNWLHRDGPKHGVDIRKPMMISEAGSAVVDGGASLSAAWYRAIPGVLARIPEVRAITLWDRPGHGACHYRFDAQPAVVRAVTAAMSATPHTRTR